MIDAVQLMNDLMRRKCLGGVQTNPDGSLKVFATSRITHRSVLFDIDKDTSLEDVLNRIDTELR